MTSPQSLRIRFYGVQGSGSTFPSAEERAAMREIGEGKLLEHVFEDLAARYPDESIESILGGPVSRESVLRYRAGFEVEPLRIYGGWTTCVHVETSDGYDIVLDCGSGFRNCARALQQKWGELPERHLHVFGSHSHFDHTEGFDQATMCFDRRNTIHVHGNAFFLRSLDMHLGIFSRQVHETVAGLQTPVTYSMMPASFECIHLADLSESSPDYQASPPGRLHDTREPIVIGRTTVRAFDLCHPAPCLGFCVEHDGKKFVFCTDHEWKPENGLIGPGAAESNTCESRLRDIAQNADLMYRDGQFLRAEYEGDLGIGQAAPVSRIGWGHSCIEDVEEMAVACHIRRTFIGHHDPNREWGQVNWIDESLARRSENRFSKVELARAEVVVDL
jgi:phosphoribosyl 1,2-cyclic phosphodiesterase